MAGTKSNTQAEGLRGVLASIADMKAMPDADIPFLTNFETMLLGYLRAPFEAQQQANQVSAGQGPPGQMPPQPPGAQPPSPMGMMGGQGIPVAPVAGRVPGILNHGGLPPVDELRRLLTAGK